MYSKYWSIINLELNLKVQHLKIEAHKKQSTVKIKIIYHY